MAEASDSSPDDSIPTGGTGGGEVVEENLESVSFPTQKKRLEAGYYFGLLDTLDYIDTDILGCMSWDLEEHCGAPGLFGGGDLPPPPSPPASKKMADRNKDIS